MTRLRTASPYLLAGLMAAAGVTHFLKPGIYDPMVPHGLPGPARAWTYVSGVAELAVAGAVMVPSTRRRGALAAAVLLIAVFPANLQMAADAGTERAVAYLRLPLQVPLVVWAWKVSRAAHRPASRARAR